MHGSGKKCGVLPMECFAMLAASKHRQQRFSAQFLLLRLSFPILMFYATKIAFFG